MKKFLIVILLSGILSCTAFAAYIGYLCPAGAKQNSTCEFVAGGRELQRIKGVVIDGDPALNYITVEEVKSVPGGLYYIQKPAQREFLNKWLRAIFKGEPKPDLPEDTTGWDEKNRYFQELDKLSLVEREMMVRGFYTRPDPLQASPSISQMAVITLKIAPDAPVGQHVIRFVGTDKRPVAFNPIPFFIGDLPEVREPFSLPPPEKPDTPVVTLPAAMNGQILPGETDHFAFTGRQGDTWSFWVYGRSLLPFIGDGVPGHFQPLLQILDAQGKEVALQDDTYFDPDPVLNFTVPSNGKYTLALRDALYRGREDFVYRIEAKPGAASYRLLPGPEWNLPRIQLSCGHSHGKGNGCAQASFPAVIEGTMLPGTPHRIQVDLTKGLDAVLEVWARRSLSPLDARLRVLGPDGKELALNDDFARPKVGPTYHQADSYLRLTAPVTGTYTIEISDATNAGGPDYRFWLRIDVPRPDFRIWAVPSGIEIPANGGTAPVGFVVERVDGFSGDITLMSMDSQYVGIAGSPVIPYGDKRPNSFESICGVQAPFPDCTKEFLTLKAQNSKTGMSPLRLLAKSGNLIHPVIPADESMQAFAYNHLIEAKDSWAVVLWKSTSKITWDFDDTAVQVIHPGDELVLYATSKEKIVDDICTAELFSPPAGFTLVECKCARGSITLRLKADATMKPCRFNQIVRLDYTREYYDKEAKENKRPKASTHLPAVMIQITK